MTRGTWGMVAAAAIAAVVALAQGTTADRPDSAAAAGEAQGAPKAASPAGRSGVSSEGRLRVKKAVLGIRHRAVHEFYDEATVKVGEEFPVGDTKYTAKVLRFVPDFGIDMKTRQVFSASDRPDNPAMQIATWEAGAAHDTSWAFLNFAPHFSKRALLAFQILRIEFDNHAPITPRTTPRIDSTATGSDR